MIHSYSYYNNTLKPLKLIVLAVALLFDLIGFFLIPSAVLMPKLFFVIITSYVFWLGLRISTIYYSYTIYYQYYKGELKITKRYYRKEIELLKINKEDIVNIKPFENDELCDQKIYIKSCIYPVYVVELQNGKKYRLCLDNTMYSALICEEKYDLFR